MKHVKMNGYTFELPCIIEPNCFVGPGDNSISSSKFFFKAVIFELEGRIVFMTKNNVTMGGKPVPGGIAIIKSKSGIIRIEGFLINLEIPGVCWILKHSDGSEGICPVCNLPFGDEYLWECNGCGIKVHDSTFCKPLSINERCFNCEG